MSAKSCMCQLCGSHNKSGIKIFSQKGVQLSMKSILLQHFSIELTETDAGSKVVCNKCWKITDKFHQLYCLVKEMVGVLSNDKQETIPPVGQNEQNIKSVDEFNFIEVDVTVKIEPDLDIIDDDLDNIPSRIQLKPEIEIFQKEHDEVNTTPDLELEIKSKQLTVRQLARKRLANSALTAKQLAKIEQDREIRNILGIVCELCHKKFLKFTNLLRHFERKHKSAGYVRCCTRKYRTRTTLFDHIQHHRDPFRLQCPVCARKFVDRRCLNKHMKRHEPNSEKFPCPECPRIFEEKRSLVAHIETVHGTESNTVICDICNKSFTSKVTVRVHMLTVHFRKNSVMCDICAKSYTTAKLLDNHYKTKHLGIHMPKFQCSICEAWVSDKKTLQTHIQFHYAKEETCSICGKNYPHRRALKSHIRKVHSGRTFSCTMCEKTFKKQLSLKEHQSAHTGFNLYECRYCDMEFKYRSSLCKHHNDRHSIEVEMDRRKGVCHTPYRIKKMC